VRKVAVFLSLGVFAAIVVMPLVWVLLTSLKTGDEIFRSPWAIPDSPQWVNYANAWEQGGIGRYFMNSLIVTVGTLVILLPAGAMAAYVLARYVFFGSKALFAGFLGGMMFPHFLVIVPLFFLLRNIGMLDTKSGLILVYVAYSLSFTIFVLFGFFQSLPDELEEAAMLDGCGHAGTFWRVMLPLAKPGLIVVAIFNAIGLWNEYGLALVLVSSEENRTLPLGIANLVMVQHYQADWGALFAGLVIVMLPVMFVYWLFRDRIHETMLAGATKG
jgi:N-acetylglucosamine transport system permease protein